MTVWFTSDTHFGHVAVLRHSGRPWSTVEEMDGGLIANWNAMVAKRDEVWHLGDFAWKDPAKYLPRLNGSIHLILGNHDQIQLCERAGFASIRPVHYLKRFDQKLYLSHYAHRTWRSSHRGSWHLYGHSHGDLLDYGKSTDVGVDAKGYRPVSFEELKALFESRPLINHHCPDRAP